MVINCHSLVSMTGPWQESVSDVDLAYLAGLIDGEGTIGIERRSGGPAHKSLRYTLTVAIQMSERPAIDHVATIFQRSVFVKKPSANMTKEAYRVTWQAGLAAELLEPLVPYLVLKRPQAVAGIEFQKEQAAARRIGATLTEESLARKEFYYRELRRLKRLP